MDYAYYIDSNGVLIRSEIYTGQTFTDKYEYDYFEGVVPIHSIVSVSPEGEVKDIIA